MTKQAEGVTVEIEGEPGLWAPRGYFVGPTEKRPVHGWEFADWFGDEQLARGPFWRRLLALTSGPTGISTALRLAVRLSLRDGRLQRKWVSFCLVEEAQLRTFTLVGARIELQLVDNTVRFTFSAEDAPIETLPTFQLVSCVELSPLHAYVEAQPTTREVHARASK